MVSLCASVDAFDVERRVGLGVTKTLRFGEHVVRSRGLVAISVR